MINPTAGKGKARFEVVRLQVGHFVENLGGVETGGEKVEHVANADAHHGRRMDSARVLGQRQATVRGSDNFNVVQIGALDKFSYQNSVVAQNGLDSPRR